MRVRENREFPFSQLASWTRETLLPSLHTALQTEAEPSPDEKQPFANMYAARRAFQEADATLREKQTLLGKVAELGPCGEGLDSAADVVLPAIAQLRALLAVGLGRNFLATEEWASGQEFLERAREGDAALPAARFPAVRVGVNNDLAALWSNRGEAETALALLVESEHVYWDERMGGVDGAVETSEMPKPFKARAGGDAAVSVETMLPEDAAKLVDDVAAVLTGNLDEAYTRTLFYLAQVTATKDRAASAKYCVATLNRQLTMGGEGSSKVELSKNSLDLSLFYLEVGQYRHAQHCIQASRYLAEQVEADGEELPEAHMARVHATFATFFEHLLKRGQLLVQLRADIAERERDANEPQRPDPVALEAADVAEFEPLFPSLRDALPRVVGAPCDFEAARDIFRKGNGHGNKALEVFVMEGFVTDHVKVLETQALLYRWLAFFEEDFKRRFTMHKRRAAIMEPLLLELNPNAYWDLVKRLTFHLGETYGDMLDMQLEKRRSDGAEAVPGKKINQLVGKGIKYFLMYQKTFEKDGSLPSTIDADYVEYFLRSYFLTARLYTKIVDVDRRVVAANLGKAAELYKFVLDYCTDNKLATLHSELDICRQMVDLLPQKQAAVLAGRMSLE